MATSIVRLFMLSLFISIFFQVDMAAEIPVIGNPEKIIDKKLKILTWNIYMLPHCSMIKGNCKRALQIAEKIKVSDYDVVVFEEAFDFRARGILRRHLKNAYPFMYGPANLSRLSLKTSSGLWVVSKIPLVKLKEIEYHHHFGIDAMAKKGAVMFQGTWNGHEFQLVGTHLQADSPDEIRRKQCDEISANLLQKFYRPHIPQLVCGDFNIEQEDSVNYHYMLQALKAENGQMDGNIFTSYDEIDNTLAKRPNGKKKIIDYILVRNSEVLHQIQRKVSVIRDRSQEKPRDLSDHYAIEATIDFEKNQDISSLSGEHFSKY